VGVISPGKSAGWPQRRLAGRQPYREVGHAGQGLQAGLRQALKSMRHSVKQSSQDIGASQFECVPELLLGAAPIVRDVLEIEENTTIGKIRPQHAVFYAVQYHRTRGRQEHFVLV